MRRPGAVDSDAGISTPRGQHASDHPLCNGRENIRLYEYERSVKGAFDNIVPVLKELSALQHEMDFESRAQQMAIVEE